MRFIGNFIRAVGRATYNIFAAVFAVSLIASLAAAATSSYFATVPGSGTSFGSLLVSGVQYAAFALCDAATGNAQCETIKAASTSAAQTDTAAVVRNPDLGATADAICETATGTCTLIQLAKYTANALTLPLPGQASDGVIIGDVGLATRTAGGVNKTVLLGLTNSVTQIKASQGQLVRLHCDNVNAAETYIQIFDASTSGSVTLGTTTPNDILPLAPNTGGGYSMTIGGVQYSNGIFAAATTAPKGASAPATNTINCAANTN